MVMINQILDSSLGQLFLQIIGSAIGIVLGLWVSKHKDRKIAKDIDTRLKNELGIIQSELEQRMKRQGRDFYMYSTPVWDICVKEGSFSKLDYGKYKQYIGVYTKIQYAQKVEEQWSNGVLANDLDKDFKKQYTEVMNEERNKMIQIIHRSIGELTV